MGQSPHLSTLLPVIPAIIRAITPVAAFFLAVARTAAGTIADAVAAIFTVILLVFDAVAGVLVMILSTLDAVTRTCGQDHRRPCRHLGGCAER